MPEYIQNIIDYLIGIQLHPIVSLVVFIVIALGRQRWEEVEVDRVKARRIGQWVLLVALAVSIVGQLAVYWPKTGQGVAINLFMSLAQVGVASFVYTYAEKWGVMERLGRRVQKKLDEKGGDPEVKP